MKHSKKLFAAVVVLVLALGVMMIGANAAGTPTKGNSSTYVFVNSENINQSTSESVYVGSGKTTTVAKSVTLSGQIEVHGTLKLTNGSSISSSATVYLIGENAKIESVSADTAAANPTVYAPVFVESGAQFIGGSSVNYYGAITIESNTGDNNKPHSVYGAYSNGKYTTLTVKSGSSKVQVGGVFDEVTTESGVSVVLTSATTIKGGNATIAGSDEYEYRHLTLNGSYGITTQDQYVVYGNYCGITINEGATNNTAKVTLGTSDETVTWKHLVPSGTNYSLSSHMDVGSSYCSTGCTYHWDEDHYEGSHANGCWTADYSSCGINIYNGTVNIVNTVNCEAYFSGSVGYGNVPNNAGAIKLYGGDVTISDNGCVNYTHETGINNDDYIMGCGNATYTGGNLVIANNKPTSIQGTFNSINGNSAYNNGYAPVGLRGNVTVKSNNGSSSSYVEIKDGASSRTFTVDGCSYVLKNSDSNKLATVEVKKANASCELASGAFGQVTTEGYVLVDGGSTVDKVVGYKDNSTHTAKLDNNSDAYVNVNGDFKQASGKMTTMNGSSTTILGNVNSKPAELTVSGTTTVKDGTYYLDEITSTGTLTAANTKETPTEIPTDVIVDQAVSVPDGVQVNITNAASLIITKSETTEGSITAKNVHFNKGNLKLEEGNAQGNIVFDSTGFDATNHVNVYQNAALSETNKVNLTVNSGCVAAVGNWAAVSVTSDKLSLDGLHTWNYSSGSVTSTVTEPTTSATETTEVASVSVTGGTLDMYDVNIKTGDLTVGTTATPAECTVNVKGTVNVEQGDAILNAEFTYDDQHNTKTAGFCVNYSGKLGIKEGKLDTYGAFDNAGTVDVAETMTIKDVQQDCVNRGTMNVKGNFIVEIATQQKWFNNRGTLRIGTAETSANLIVKSGIFYNGNQHEANTTVNGDLSVESGAYLHNGHGTSVASITVNGKATNAGTVINGYKYAYPGVAAPTNQASLTVKKSVTNTGSFTNGVNATLTVEGTELSNDAAFDVTGGTATLNGKVYIKSAKTGVNVASGASFTLNANGFVADKTANIDAVTYGIENDGTTIFKDGKISVNGTSTSSGIYNTGNLEVGNHTTPTVASGEQPMIDMVSGTAIKNEKIDSSVAKAVIYNAAITGTNDGIATFGGADTAILAYAHAYNATSTEDMATVTVVVTGNAFTVDTNPDSKWAIRGNSTHITLQGANAIVANNLKPSAITCDGAEVGTAPISGGTFIGQLSYKGVISTTGNADGVYSTNFYPVKTENGTTPHYVVHNAEQELRRALELGEDVGNGAGNYTLPVDIVLSKDANMHGIVGMDTAYDVDVKAGEHVLNLNGHSISTSTAAGWGSDGGAQMFTVPSNATLNIVDTKTYETGATHASVSAGNVDQIINSAGTLNIGTDTQAGAKITAVSPTSKAINGTAGSVTIQNGADVTGAVYTNNTATNGTCPVTVDASTVNGNVTVDGATTIVNGSSVTGTVAITTGGNSKIENSVVTGDVDFNGANLTIEKTATGTVCSVSGKVTSTATGKTLVKDAAIGTNATPITTAHSFTGATEIVDAAVYGNSTITTGGNSKIENSTVTGNVSFAGTKLTVTKTAADKTNTINGELTVIGGNTYVQGGSKVYTTSVDAVFFKSSGNLYITDADTEVRATSAAGVYITAGTVTVSGGATVTGGEVGTPKTGIYATSAVAAVYVTGEDTRVEGSDRGVFISNGTVTVSDGAVVSGTSRGINATNDVTAVNVTEAKVLASESNGCTAISASGSKANVTLNNAYLVAKDAINFNVNGKTLTVDNCYEIYGDVQLKNGTAALNSGAVNGKTYVSGAAATTDTNFTFNGDVTVSGGSLTNTSGKITQFMGNLNITGGEVNIYKNAADTALFQTDKAITVSDTGNLTVQDDAIIDASLTKAVGAEGTVCLKAGTSYKGIYNNSSDTNKLADMMDKTAPNAVTCAVDWNSNTDTNEDVYETNGFLKENGALATAKTYLKLYAEKVTTITLTSSYLNDADAILIRNSVTNDNEQVTFERIALKNSTSGAEFTLTPAIDGSPVNESNRQIYWTSSDATYVVINDTNNVRTFGTASVTIKVDKNTPVGDYTITAESVENPGVKDVYTIHVAATSLTGATVTLNQSSFVYDNTAKTPVPTVKVTINGVTYTLADTEYTKTGNTSETAVNNYTLTIAGNTTDTVTGGTAPSAAWNIQNTDIAGAVITLTPSSFTKSDNAQGPAIVVTYNGTPLTKDVDYTINGNSVLSATNAGTYTIQIDGKGTYGGTKTATWTINNPSGGTGGGGGGGAVAPKTYTITCGTGVKADVKSSTAGKTITLTVSEGYENIVVKDADGKAVTVSGNTFTMPEADVTVSVSKKGVATTYDKCDKGEACVLKAFNDLDAWRWYHDGIHYCLDNGVMNGLGNGEFAPTASTTRGMIFTILARLDGVTITSTGNEWYTDGQAWSVKAGVSDGTNPTGNITREQLAAMLYRYAKLKGYDVSVGEDTNILSYDDAFSVSEYAVGAMQWAVGAGIINGDNNNLKPTTGATRAEVATMLMRFCETVVK